MTRRIGISARVRISLVCVALFITPGCLDYGDVALKFVEDDAFGLSKDIAQASLTGLWMNAGKVMLLESVARSKEWVESVESTLGAGPLVIPESATGPEILQLLRENEHRLDRLLKLKFQADEMSRIRQSWASVCSSEAEFYAMGLNAISWMAPLRAIVPPTDDQGVGTVFIFTGEALSTLIISAVITVIDNLFKGHKSKEIEEQNAKLRTAQRLVFDRIPQSEELFGLSKAACANASDAFAAVLEPLAAAEAARSSLINLELSVVAVNRTVLERRLLASPSGTSKEVKAPTGALIAQLTVDARRGVNELKFLEGRARAATGIVRIESIEDLGDAAAELCAQSALFIPRVSSSSEAGVALSSLRSSCESGRSTANQLRAELGK